METMNLVDEKVEQVFSLKYTIEIFKRMNGKHFAMTKISEFDAIISDGDTVEDTFNRHTKHLSIALSTNVRQDVYNQNLFPAAIINQF